MSDSESEQETEVFFRNVEATVHQVEVEQQNEHEEHRSIRRPDSPNNVDQDDEILRLSGQVRQNYRQTISIPKSESNIEKAVNDMVKMQNQMTEVLKKVSDVVVDALSSKQQHRQDGQINNNNYRDVNVDLTPHVREHQQKGRSLERGDNPEYENDNQYRQGPYDNRPNHRTPHLYKSNVKLPPFSGKDDWTVWINRFEAVSERQNWTNEEKLDHLLPKLEGIAGEFVFTQLKREVLRDYEELTNEINNRFRVIETPKTFAAKFSKRDQRPNETVEEYAAELKRLYDKAYKARDRRTRREDLVRRFLDGLRDDELSWEVEYIKDPSDIDEAVYHVVNSIQTRKKHQHEGGERRKNFIKKTNEDDDEEAEDRYESRMVKEKTEKKSQGQDKVGDPKSSVDSELLHQILAKLSELTSLRKPEDTRQRKPGKRVIVCYACNQENHYARDCPFRQHNLDPRNYAASRDQGQCGEMQQLNHYATPSSQPLNFNGPTRMAEVRSQMQKMAM